MSEVTTIDTLSLEITSNSNGAAKGIDELAASLGKLKQSGSIGVAVKNLNNLSDSLKKLTPVASNANKLNALADSISKLAAVGSMARVINQLGKLPGAVKGLSDLKIDGTLAEKANGLAAALVPLSNIKTGGLGTMVNALGRIGKVTDSLDGETIARFAGRVKELNTALEPLSTKMTTVQMGLRGMNNAAKTAGNGVKDLGSKVDATTLNLASMITVMQGMVSVLTPVVRLLSSTISQAMEWDGVAARFGRGFGSQANEVYDWVKRLNEEMGINTQQFMQYSSVFSTMLQGFGVGLEDSSKMAVGYTELVYDIWAGYNDIYKSFGDAAEAVKSAIAGEVEPIRRAGFTIVESTLQQTAANYGLEISLEKATEAEKSYLRYLTLVDQAQAQSLVGTYARELNTAEGLTRTLSQQLKSLAQTFGSLFLPILAKVLPWLQAFVNLLTEAIVALAAFFGIEIQPVSWGSGIDAGVDAIDGVGAAADSATDSLGGTQDAVGKTADALKDLKKATLGIDELNVISPPNEPSGGSGGGEGGGAIGDAFEGLDFDSLWDESIFNEIQFEVDRIKSLLEGALSSITAMISGFLLAIGTILVVSGANIPLGLSLMAIGAVGLVTVIAQNWDSMTDQLAKTLTVVTSVLGGFLLAIGAFLAFSGVNVGLGAALMVAGAVSLGTAVTINWKFLEGSFENTLSILTGIISGGLLAMGALFAFTGVSVGLGIGLMAAGAVGLATSVGLNWDAMSEPLRKAIGTLETIVGTAMLSFGAILAFSGANIPLGLGLIAAGAVSLVAAEQLNWNSLNGTMENKIATLSTLVGGAALGLGAVLAFSGVALPVGIALMAVGAAGIVAAASINWTSLSETVKTVLKEMGVAIGAALLAVGAVLAFSGVALPLGISLMAAGAVGLVSGVALNWNTIVTAIEKTVKEIGVIAGAAMLALGVLLVCSGVGLPLGIGLIAAGATSLVAGVTLNWDTISSKVKEIVGKIGDWIKQYGLLALGVILCLTGGGIPMGIALIKQGLDTKTEKGTTVGDELLKLIKEKWEAIKTWWNSKPELKAISAKVEDIKAKISEKWEAAKKWWNGTSTLEKVKVAVSLAKSGWSTVKKWIGSIPAVSQAVKLAKSGWSTVKKWVGTMPTLSAGIKLAKSGWTTISKWLGNLTYSLKFKLPKIKVNWGSREVLGFKITYPTGFSTYAKGGFPDMGELFVAREAGPEMVGKIGNRTTVANNEQIVKGISEGVYTAVLAAMRASESNGSQAVNVYLDGKLVTQSVEKRQHERGASIMGRQVYSY